ncbi:hypothetical protein [Thioclava sp. GXIMD2076]|uniref:Uncharacterized protein n=1 Tax=Thioclava kandeliae TaxID=3070818 RepID=A0ABV1SHS3_9RHOB
MLAAIICSPAVFLPGTGADTMQIVGLVALACAALTVFEYSSVYPSLVEFRDAAPYNRIRFLLLATLVLSLSLAAIAPFEPTVLNRLLVALGQAIAGELDFSYSPLHLMMQSLPAHAAPETQRLVGALAGLALGISLIGVAIFLLVFRVMGWPGGQERFNIWINLPTFDPTMGGDVVERLRRDAWVNTSLGLVCPFLMPVALKLVSIAFPSMMPASQHALIWVVTAWAFLPALLVMRGVALGRVSALIAQRRRSARAAGEEDGQYQTA